MYIPQLFEVTDKETLYALMEQNSFAVLFSQHEGKPCATHLPLLLDESEGYLYGHMAKANPHWASLKGEVLVVFAGAHSYISSSWYETPNSVPTWNYTAVHVYGHVELIEDHAELLKIVDQSVSHYESSMPNPWSMSQADPTYINNLSKGIVGFKIHISKIEGKWKLSQNHSKERQERVIDALELQKDVQSRQIAKLMKDNVKRSSL